MPLPDVIAQLRAQGDDNQANLLATANPVPGQGVDFTQLSHVLLLALLLFVGSSVLLWLQGFLLNGVIQSVVRELRREAEEKLNRLPLEYFDGQPRGELLSRVTNDVDNISQTLQQTLSRLLTSLLTIVGVLILMFSISPELAVIALVAVPLSVVVTRQIAKRSQPLFIAQWQHTGALNARHRGGVLRARAGEGVRAPAGGRGGVPGEERGAVPGQLRRPVRVRDRSCP